MGRKETFALSGNECVVALGQLGFVVTRREPGQTVMRQFNRIVVVPDVLELSTSLLDRILRDADLSYGALLRAIDELPTDPELCVIEA